VPTHAPATPVTAKAATPIAPSFWLRVDIDVLNGDTLSICLVNGRRVRRSKIRAPLNPSMGQQQKCAVAH
jgi:hypothetical protein